MSPLASRILSAAVCGAFVAAGTAPLSGKPRVTKPSTLVNQGPVIRNPDISPVSCHGGFISGMAAETQNLVQSQNAAIGYWSANAAQLVGPGYSDWNNAQSKTLTCVAGNTPNSHLCTARANPCAKAV